MSLNDVMQRHHTARWHTVREHLLVLLAKHWGATSFLPGQEEVIEQVVFGRDVVAALPTGGGKSLCYQLPAIIGRGLTVVVSPLVSLMTDQVAALGRKGISAAKLDSTLHPTEADDVARRAHRGELRLLYMSPERLSGPEGMALLNRCVVDRFVVDEAHCIGTWGPDFRPAYAQLSVIRQLWPQAPILAVTATADAVARQEIAHALQLRDPFVYAGSFDRPNLYLAVDQRNDSPSLPGRGQGEGCGGQVFDWVFSTQRRHERCGILVYCATRAETERLAAHLLRRRIRVARYHAGLSDEERQQTQERFASGELDVVVATVAFGMGIDRPDVRLVLHTMMPASLEQYHQEIGRAGRDGQPAHAVLLVSNDDINYWETVLGLEDYATLLGRGGAEAIQRADPDGRLTARYESLVAMHGYAVACGLGYDSTCRHAHLAAHFGEDIPPCIDKCDACGSRASSPGSSPEATE